MERVSPKKGSTYSAWENFPPEVQVEIIHHLDPQTQFRSAQVSKGFRILAEEKKYEKRTQFLLSREKDPVRTAIQTNDLDYFRYLLEKKFHVYWGALIEIFYLKRNDFLKVYDFEIKDARRIGLILRIILETHNKEVYELVKERLKKKDHIFIHYFQQINQRFLKKIERDFSRYRGNEFFSLRTFFIPEKDHLKKIIREGAILLREKDQLKNEFKNTIIEDDLDALKILVEEKWIDLTDSEYLKSLGSQTLIEADILRYLMKREVNFQEYFEEIVEVGNLYTAENLLLLEFQLSDMTINHILQDLWDNADHIDYSFAEEVLNWLLSYDLITEEQRSDILDIYPEEPNP